VRHWQSMTLAIGGASSAGVHGETETRIDRHETSAWALCLPTTQAQERTGFLGVVAVVALNRGGCHWKGPGQEWPPRVRDAASLSMEGVDWSPLSALRSWLTKPATRAQASLVGLAGSCCAWQRLCKRQTQQCWMLTL